MPESSPEDVKVDANVTDVAEAPTEAKTQDVKEPAGSSKAESENGDLLSAVKAALEPKEKTLDSAEPGPKDDTTAKDAKKDGAPGEEESDELTEDEFAQLSWRSKKRIKSLVAAREQVKAEKAQLEETVGDLKPKAERFEEITRFVEDAGLSKDEVNDGFNIMRDLKHNPLKAYERLKPLMSQLAIMAGDALPQDLQEQVQVGRITQDYASELQRARSETQVFQAQTARLAQMREEEIATRQHQAHVNSVASHVSEWERQQERSDPDWKLKQPRVLELMELEVRRNGFPRNTTEANAMADSSLKRVNEEFRKLAPLRREIKPLGEVASTRSTAKPTSALEAAKMALAASG